MKKNKLYTANKWNQPAFMPKDKNLFAGPQLGPSQMQRLKLQNMSTNPGGGLSSLGVNMTPQLTTSSLGLGSLGKGGTGSLFASNPTEFFGLGNDTAGSVTRGAGLSGLMSGVGGAALNAGAGLLGGLANSAISGGLESGAGSAISGLGSTVGGAIGTVNPVVGAAVSVGSQLLGGLANRAFGSKLNEEKIAEIEAKNAQLAQAGNTMGAAGDKQSLLNSWGDVDINSSFRKNDIGEDGWFANKAEKKYEALKRQKEIAEQNALMGFRTGLHNIETAEDTAIADNFIYSNGGPLFAFGGDLQVNGSDFPTGLIHIDAGLSHELNPNEGVQLGVDPEGTPNLVEEGETVFDDYVYSNRILADAQTKEKFGLPRKKDITFADISKKLEKESSERPNDPISQAGLKAQMHQLADEQERQKQEMDAQRAKAAFEALSPEEQVAVMENAAQQEAMAEQAAMQQPSPEEIAMAQQQQAMADGSQAALGQEPQMNCFGGKINRFDLGGQAYTKMLNSLGFHTQKEFDDWAKENNIDLSKVWDTDERTLSYNILSNLWKDENFKKALKAKNAALAHAFSEKGYDWGAYQPTDNGKATIQSISKGNWKTTNGKGWRGSEDLAFKQATEGLSDEGIDALTTEQLAERMRKTPAYQNTNKWLQNSNNALQYLNTLLNDPDTPEVAKEYARKFVKDGKWKDDFNYDYATVFGSNGNGVRETNPGTYWHTALEANRGNQAGNFVINEDGTVEPIVGDVPTDWTSAGNYTWADEDNDYTYNYYKRPVATPSSPQSPAEKTAPEGTDGKDSAPTHRAEWLRYAGLFGPAVGLGLQAAGVGRPDTAQLDAAIEGAGDVTPADWKPLGNYLTYRPLDIWFEQNRLNANARATERGILNSGTNQGSKMAGLLAAGYNDQIASGNLFRQAQEYNDNLRKQVAEFNRGTDQFNSEQYGATSRFNADAYNNARRTNAQLRLQAAAQKMDADAGWYNSLYGNIAGLFKGIGDIGTENFRMNRIGEMAARGDFGTATDETYGFEPYLTRSNRKSKKNR